jgi:lysophospholipase L1-like esterase
MSRRLFPAPLVLVLLSTLVTALAAAPAQAAPRSADTTVDYVALGDSYAAGTGSPGARGLCMRSDRGYPSLWAQRTGARLRYVACGGATTDDVRRDQLSALDAQTDLVTITIGGNDAGFAPILVSCALASDAGCTRTVNRARKVVNESLPGKLDATYAAIRSRAPGARIVVLGYPRLFQDTDACLSGFSRAKRRLLNDGANDLADIIAERAEAASIEYIDVRPAFAEHGVCARRAWIHGLSLLDPTSSFHPTGDGQASGYLPAFRTVVG